MARTNTRTQMIAGLLLNEVKSLLLNIEDVCPAAHDDRSWDVLRNDVDYQNAKDLVIDALIREMRKTRGRAEGSNCYSLNEIDEITMTEA